MTYEEFLTAFDAHNYNNMTVVKAKCPYVVTVYQRAEPAAFRYIKDSDIEFMVMVFPKRCNMDVAQRLFATMEQLTSDWLLL